MTLLNAFQQKRDSEYLPYACTIRNLEKVYRIPLNNCKCQCQGKLFLTLPLAVYHFQTISPNCLCEYDTQNINFSLLMAFMTTDHLISTVFHINS